MAHMEEMYEMEEWQEKGEVDDALEREERDCLRRLAQWHG